MFLYFRRLIIWPQLPQWLCSLSRCPSPGSNTACTRSAFPVVCIIQTTSTCSVLLQCIASHLNINAKNTTANTVGQVYLTSCLLCHQTLANYFTSINNALLYFIISHNDNFNYYTLLFIATPFSDIVTYLKYVYR